MSVLFTRVPTRACLAALFIIISVVGAAALSAERDRDALEKLFQEGQFKEALEGFQARLRDPEAAATARDDLEHALACLDQLHRPAERDALVEEAVKLHGTDWRLLWRAALACFQAEGYGYLVSGEFHRGYHRGGGEWTTSTERDRSRALQLMAQALKHFPDLGVADAPRREMATFHQTLSQMLLRDHNQAWRLQVLTDLSILPDYGDARSGSDGAPVDADGQVVTHKVPASFDAAKTDGERWRWALTQAAELDPMIAPALRLQFARFLRQQWDVQTMAQYGNAFAGGAQEDESGPYALRSLKENETICRTAAGVKRFGLSEGFDFIALLKGLAEQIQDASVAEQAVDDLARLFSDRRQHPRAAEFWQAAIKRFGEGHDAWRRQALDQIVKPWGRFEGVPSTAAGQPASCELRFRNAAKAKFKAERIDIKKLVDDVQAYLRDNPGQLEWRKLNLGDIGHRLIDEDGGRYLGETVARWELELKSPPAHLDARTTVATPLKDAGAYLVSAQIEGGNTARVIVWLQDTALVRKRGAKNYWYAVLDAAGGAPVAQANLHFFGYRQERVGELKKMLGRHSNVIVEQFARASGEDGQLVLEQKDLTPSCNWMVTASTEGGRYAFLGFEGVWYQDEQREKFDHVRTLVITDRPVYRPGQDVRYKIWLRRARYDLGDVSEFAEREFDVVIHDAKGEKMLETRQRTDAWGGIAGEIKLGPDAALGIYSVQVTNMGGGHFRVEEYKKPEFEVTVEAPEEAIRLGESFEAKIKAKYYFGAPVTQATVKYKVLRQAQALSWYPIGDWDWLYGNGYWWFADDYPWFPGWRDWGCCRPIPMWWGWYPDPPEIVAEAELPIGEDGTLTVKIDSAAALAMHPDQDHRYDIQVEVVDASRRTIVGGGQVRVARKPFQVYAWVDRGHYRAGETVRAGVQARDPNGKNVTGSALIELRRVRYTEKGPEETVVEKATVELDAAGQARQDFRAAAAGQYRIAAKVTSKEGHQAEGGYVFIVMGEGAAAEDFRFNALELVPDKREYAPGEKVRLLVSSSQAGATVLLFLRPVNGLYGKPQLVKLEGKSGIVEIEVGLADMPNFFIEGLTVHGGRLHQVVREILVPPATRVLNLSVAADAASYEPGAKAKVELKLTGPDGKPFVGSTVLAVYDQALEYISGGSNVPELRSFFWAWRRSHHPQTWVNLGQVFYNLLKQGEVGMGDLGVFGELTGEELEDLTVDRNGHGRDQGATRSRGRSLSFGGEEESLREKADGAPAPPGARAPVAGMAKMAQPMEGPSGDEAGGGGGAPLVQPVIRKEFADTAYWNAAITTDADGHASIDFKLPENLTGWKIKAWAMGHGTRVGEASSNIVTAKKLLLRLQAPRFFTQKDEVVLSANVHNYLEAAKQVTVKLELEGGTLEPLGETSSKVEIAAQGEARVDFRVRAVSEGRAVVRMLALSDTASDAMQMDFPVQVHGFAKTVSYSGHIRGEATEGKIVLQVPAERRINDSALIVRYSPTLATALVDALPYLAEYPYGCTEQTLNRFLPTVITQKLLKEMGLDLKAIQDKRANLNAQELGEGPERAKQWRRFDRNPVFDEKEVANMVDEGLKALYAMQLSDGGWGWFSGWGEHSSPHTTATVLRGLLAAKAAGVAIVPGVLQRGLSWMKAYQDEQIRLLRNASSQTKPWKEQADDTDALVYHILGETGSFDEAMRDFLYRDRLKLSIYGKALYALALHAQGRAEELAMVQRNLEQFLKTDAENQTAWLDLQNGHYWWYWYGSEFEAHAAYLKLLARVEPKGDKAAWLAKYLLNNRKHATYWNSTRDTALCIEALAEFARASGETSPEVELEILVDGKSRKKVKIDQENLFSYDDRLVLLGDAIETGEHVVSLKKSGPSPIYFNAYLSYFSLEDFITRAGLEIKVDRKFYRLKRADRDGAVVGGHGQVVKQHEMRYEREELASASEVKSGDLIEVELSMESKNDYEYIIFEDLKAAGLEAEQVQSGYIRHGLPAYMELRDNRVCFFVRSLARGTHSVAYRLRAEIPGNFSALPTRAYAMYAPELKANSDEMKLSIADR